MKGITKRSAIALSATAFLAMLFFYAHSVKAQQSDTAASPAIKQEVPDNPMEHTPPEQPIPYSHKIHAGTLSLPCATCHTNPDPGNMMTFPSSEKCMSCHHSIAKNKPAIKKLAALAKTGQPIPWVRVYKILPGVNWSHRKHLEAGMKCQMCHGQVQDMERMSEATSVTTMGVCLRCHQEHGAPVVCQTCHSWPPAN